MTKVKKNWFNRYFAKEEEKRLVYGIVLEPDTVDAQDDYISAEAIEKTAHNFMLNSQIIRDGHTKEGLAKVVESMIAPIDFELMGQPIKKGSWVLVTKITDDMIWEGVKKGEYTGYSIGGVGMRAEKKPIEAEIPDWLKKEQLAFIQNLVEEATTPMDSYECLYGKVRKSNRPEAVMKQIERLADDVLKKNPSMGKAKATTVVMEQFPDLYSDYLRATDDAIEVRKQNAPNIQGMANSIMEYLAQVKMNEDPNLTQEAATKKILEENPALYKIMYYSGS